MSHLSNKILADNPRTLEDAMRSLQEFGDKVEEIIQLRKQFARQLKAASFTLTVDTSAEDKAMLKNSPVPVPTSKIAVKDMESLRKNCAIIQELWDVREAFEANAVSVRQTFANRGKDVDKFLAENAKLKLRIDKELEDAFTMISGLAQANLPPKMIAFNHMIVNALRTSIQYDEVKQYNYLYEVVGDLCFSTYTHLISVSDDEGTYYPALFIVSSCRIGVTPATYVAVLTKFVPPSERLLMKKVTSSKETMRALSMLLAMDNFSTSIGSIPIATLLKGPVKRELFLYQNLIKSITVDENEVKIILKPEVTSMPEVGRIIDQMQLDFQVATKKTGTKMTRKVDKPMRSDAKCYIIRFFFNPPNDVLWATPEDLQFLKERFQLSESTLNTMVRTINSGSPN